MKRYFLFAFVFLLGAANSQAQVIEPSGFSKNLNYGSQSEKGLRLYEYQIKCALPGSYKVNVSRDEWDIEPFTIRAIAYIRWASGKEEKKVQTLLLENRELDLDDVVFDWGE